MQIDWLSLFGDVPADGFDASLRFWARITGSTPGTPTGPHQEWTPLLAPRGDRYVWLQRLDDGGPAWHPDFHVADVEAAAQRAMATGAREVRRADDLVVLQTPAGQPFCLVTHEGQRDVPTADPDAGAPQALLRQICLDIPAAAYDAELDFWASFTEWPIRTGTLDEFRDLVVPAHLPLRILLQRLGDDDTGGARAHADISSDDRAAEVARHEAQGAAVDLVAEGWTALRAPGGLVYCLTDRVPRRPGDDARRS
jgi:hypothetical protein